MKKVVKKLSKKNSIGDNNRVQRDNSKVQLTEIINELFNLNRVLVSPDAKKALGLISKHLKLKKIRVYSGAKVLSWIVPKSWSVDHASLIEASSGKAILSYKDNPLHLFVYSKSFEGTLSYKELKEHLRFDNKNPNAIPYIYKYYNSTWGFSLSKKQFDKLKPNLKYKVSIETDFKDDYLEIGEATIKGKTDSEILVIAHTDHPFQANDNLSGVAVAIGLAKELKSLPQFKHTIKILFLPETIGSIAYIAKRKKNLDKVIAVIALDIVGNKNRILIQETLNPNDDINYVAAWSCRNQELEYELAEFRKFIGSDELVFSDPKFNIPSIMISTYPYPEYHTDLDKPEIIDEKTLESVKNVSLNIIKVLDQNFVPERLWEGPLMRAPIGWFLGKQEEDRKLEIFGYKMDGKKSVIEIAKETNLDLGIAFEFCEDLKKFKLIK